MNRRQLLGAMGGLSTVLSGCSGKGIAPVASIRTPTSPSDEAPNTGETSGSPAGGTTDNGGSFSATSPTVEQGEIARISIEATNIEWMEFTDVPVEGGTTEDSEYFEVKFEDAAFTPPPDVVLESWPPTWEWSPAQNVEGTVPVQTYSETQPGTYHLTVAVYAQTAEETKPEEISVRVESTSDG